MEYFYTPPGNIKSGIIIIDGEEFTHLTHVMRKKAGDEVVVVDGAGNAYHTRLTEITKREARCTLLQHTPRLHEPNRDVTLAVGILKNPSRFDFLVEKATELGVNRIVPLITARTIGKHAKIDRWQKIALAAMKQSGRCVLPQVDPLTRFSDFIRTATQHSKLVAHEKSKTSAFPNDAKTIALCVGPEGGFADEEVVQAEDCGFRLVSLGERRLRTETAAVAGVVKVLS